MDSPEKLAPLGTQDTRRTQTKQKHNTICVGPHYSQTNTNNANKTRILLQTTGGKDEENIVAGSTTRNSDHKNIISGLQL